MFTAIAVDDEKKALDRFEHVMLDEPRLYLAGKFSDPDEAIAFAKQVKIDVAFLDIDMPSINGLMLAEKLLAVRPRLEIIFVTAYEQYALEAFRLHAAGYLLKPIGLEELSEMVNTVVRRRGDLMTASYDVPLVVRCFGSFRCYPESDEDRLIQWRTAKTEELFALLVNNLGIAMPRELIVDTLWPDVDPEKAANRFRVTCTYLRNNLAASGYPDMLLRERDSYRLDMQRIRCDFVQAAALLPSLAAGNIEHLEQFTRICAQNYLADRSYEWALRQQRLFDQETRRYLGKLAEIYQKNQKPDQYAGALQAILNRDPCDESAAAELIAWHMKTGERDTAVKLYREYEQHLEAELGIKPSVHMQALLKAR